MNVHTLTQGHPLLTSGAVEALTHRSLQAGDRIVICRDCKNIYREETWEAEWRREPRHGGRDNTFETIPAELYEIPGPRRPPAPAPHTPVSNGGRPQSSAPPQEPRRRANERPQAAPPTGSRPRMQLLDPVVRRTGPRPRVKLLESWRPLPPSPAISTPPMPAAAPPTLSVGKAPLQIPPAIWFAAGAAAAGLLALLLLLAK